MHIFICRYSYVDTYVTHIAFFTDLEQWIEDYREEEMEIIICLDANEPWSEHAGIKKFAHKLNLRNINQEMGIKPTHPNVSNISKSTNIDYCLCSENIITNISFAASAPYELDVLGDHRGIIIDLNIQRMFNEWIKVEDKTIRKLSLSNPKAIDKYLKEVEEKFHKQNIFRRSQQLLSRVVKGHTDIDRIMYK